MTIRRAVKKEIDRGRRAGVTPLLTFGGAGVIGRGAKYDCAMNGHRFASSAAR